MISVIEPSPHDPATAYVAATCYKSDDLRPYLYRTNDYGASWTKITGGIPDHEFTRVIRADPNRRGLLFCGTESGIFASFDDGVAWQRLQTNLPVTPIWDLVIKGTDLVVATHGRSFWILDDITPLYQLQPEVVVEPAHLFAPRDSVRYRLYGRPQGKSKTHTNYKMTGPVTVAFRRVETPSGAVQEKFLDAGQNPPDGVIIHYWLRDKADSVRLAILDAQGNEVRAFTNKRERKTAEAPPTDSAEAEEPAEGEVQQLTGEEEVSSEAELEELGPWAPNEAGMNRFIWDYRYEKPAKIEGKSRGSREEALESVGGPRAAPGEYQVQLTVGEQTLVQRFRLLVDPRLPVNAQDLEAQFELKRSIRDRSSEAHTAINQIRAMRRQIDDWDKRCSSGSGSDSEDRAARLKGAAKSARDELKSIEAELINVDFEKPRPGPNRIKEKFDALGSMVDESDDRPTQGAYEVYDMLRGQLEAQLERLKQAVDGPVKSFNELVQSLGIPPVGV